MFTCFSALQRSANAKTTVNKHKFVGLRLREGRYAGGRVWFSLQSAPSRLYPLRALTEIIRALAAKQDCSYLALQFVRLTSNSHHV